MTKLSVLMFLMAVLCTSLHTAQGFKCYQCDSYTALVNCTKVQTVVTCDNGVKECCIFSETGTFYRTGKKYKYFGKGCEGRKHEEPLAVIDSFGAQCCGPKSLCNTSHISQASIVLVSCLILVSKMISIV